MSIVINLVVLLALVLLFAAGLRAPLGQGRARVVSRVAGVVGVLVVALLATIVAYRNDQHFDLTREEAFTPAPETLQVLRELKEDVELVYFYQQQNPAGRAAKQMVEIMAKVTPHLKVRTVDPDQQPALASQLGVRMYNAALLVKGERRIEVITTEDREIALGLLRLLRSDKRPLCFLAGHGEYDIDNFEFHTHFEGSHAHNHDAGGASVVNIEQHGIGRVRRALDKLGYTVRKLNLATGGAEGVPADCAALVDANPRTPYAPPEVALLGRYLEGGGNLLMLIEPDYTLGPELAALLARAGVRVGDGVIVDPVSHYFSDEQMVAVEKYANHPATRGLAMSFYPGARPLDVVAAGVTTQVLFSTSAKATVATASGKGSSGKSVGDTVGSAGEKALAIASEGRLSASDKPFRLAVVGDADFASNSFYPYLANADLVLGLAAWLRGEQRGPAMKPPVEVLPTVALNNSQMQAIFIGCVLVLPGLCAALGIAVWWRRRY
jgi:ABC-type uncharacterized transport system involved in gliding motility auxiliary subunit